MAEYPSKLKTWVPVSDNVDDVRASHINEAYEEIIAVEAALGKDLENVVKNEEYTASEVLTKLKTVDGAGSGLDADLLDGKHASDFALSSQVLTNVPANAKFTDTTYSEITTAEIDAGTASTLRTITGRRVKYILDKVQSWINALTKADVGLSNVDNTSDLNKPISTATQAALNGKVDNSRVLTDVPSSAIFTDTITTVNGKTGAIAKADIVALGIPAQDTVYTHPATHPPSIITQDASNRFVTDTEKSTWNNKADTKQVFTVTLTAAGWSGTAPFTQTVNVTGMTSAMNPIADIVLSETYSTAKTELEDWGKVGKIVTNNGSITATCYDDKPTVALNVILVEVK